MKKEDKILTFFCVAVSIVLGIVFRMYDSPANATTYNVTVGSRGVFDALSVRTLDGLPSADFDGVVASSILVDNSRTAIPHVQINGSLSVRALNQYPSADFDGVVATSINAGQITLSGTTRTTWPSGPNTTKGDIYGYNSADARIPIGLNRQLLQSDSTQILGLGWVSDIQASTASFTASTHSSLTMTGAVNPSGQNATAGFVGVSATSLLASDTMTFKGAIHDSTGKGSTTGQVLTAAADGTPYWATAAAGGGVTAASGQIARDMITASGSVSYTVCGFLPTAVLFFGVEPGNGGPPVFWGMSTGANTGNAVWGESSNFSTDTAAFTKAIVVKESVPTNNQTGQITSFDATGFTVSWVKTGTPASWVYINVLCLK